MRTKLIALMLLAGGSAFAESHWSISIGGFAPGYYPPPHRRLTAFTSGRISTRTIAISNAIMRKSTGFGLTSHGIVTS